MVTAKKKRRFSIERRYISHRIAPRPRRTAQQAKIGQRKEREKISTNESKQTKRRLSISLRLHLQRQRPAERTPYRCYHPKPLAAGPRDHALSLYAKEPHPKKTKNDLRKNTRIIQGPTPLFPKHPHDQMA